MKLRLRKGDQVTVLAGKDKGRSGKVLHTTPDTNTVIVEGVNMVTKHQKPTQSARATPQTQTGRIVKPAPLSAGKVMLICPHCSKPSRVGSGVDDAGRKMRRCNKCDQLIGD
jgi:large subunit ribosomal protein L24